VFRTVHWPSLCCICLCVPYSALAFSMLHLSLCSVQCTGLLYAASVPVFHTEQRPSLSCICPCVPYSTLATSILHLSLCFIQCSGHLYATSVPMFHKCSGHLYATPFPVRHPVQWPLLYYICPYVPYSAVAISVLHLSLYAI